MPILYSFLVFEGLYNFVNWMIKGDQVFFQSKYLTIRSLKLLMCPEIYSYIWIKLWLEMIFEKILSPKKLWSESLSL